MFIRSSRRGAIAAADPKRRDAMAMAAAPPYLHPLSAIDAKLSPVAAAPEKPQSWWSLSCQARVTPEMIMSDRTGRVALAKRR
jgi:hypothetical protein